MNDPERGFTLLEVVAALLIISFIFISILSLMQSTKKLSAENIDQLVMTSFATGSLKRFLDNPTLYISDSEVENTLEKNEKCEKSTRINCYFQKKIEQLSPTESITFLPNMKLNNDLFHLKANNQDYYLQFILTQDDVERRKELINVVSFVSKDKDFLKGRVKVEGYLSYAENTETSNEK